MRIGIVIVCLVAWLAAPVIAAWPDTCAHATSGMAHDAADGDHAMMAEMAMPAEAAPCECDPGCADHCEGVSSPALVSFFAPQDAAATAHHRRALDISLYLDPPRSGLLRPPQHRIR